MDTAAIEGLRLEDEAEVVIRAVNADDAPMLQAFVRGLSVRSRRFRFFSALVELSAARLDRLVRPDRIGLALVALRGRSEDAAIVGEARYVVDQRIGRYAASGSSRRRIRHCHCRRVSTERIGNAAHETDRRACLENRRATTVRRDLG